MPLGVKLAALELENTGGFCTSSFNKGGDDCGKPARGGRSCGADTSRGGCGSVGSMGLAGIAFARDPPC